MKSLDKALNILNLFLNGKPEMSTSEIARLSKLNKPTVCRMGATLVKHGYLIQQKKRGNYSLGTIYLSYYRVLTSNLYLRNIVLPHLNKLSQQINEPTTIAYKSGIEDLYPETSNFPSENKLEVTKTDDRLPLNATSLGKLFLADLTDKELESYFNSKSMKRCTPNTILDINTIEDSSDKS